MLYVIITIVITSLPIRDSLIVIAISPLQRIIDIECYQVLIPHELGPASKSLNNTFSQDMRFLFIFTILS